MLCGGRGLFFGSGCVMSSNLPEQPISSRDRGKSSGPTGGKSTDRREQQFISTTATRCKCKVYNLSWHQKAHKTHLTITVRCTLQCSCWVGCLMSDLWHKAAKCWASCWWYYYTTTGKHAELLIKTVLMYIFHTCFVHDVTLQFFSINKVSVQQEAAQNKSDGYYDVYLIFYNVMVFVRDLK